MDINLMMKQAKKMQKKVEELQEELAKKEFVIEKQGVKLVMLGNRKIKSLEINEALMDPEEKDILEGLVMIAVNEAIEQIDIEEDRMMPKTPQGGLGF